MENEIKWISMAISALAASIASLIIAYNWVDPTSFFDYIGVFFAWVLIGAPAVYLSMFITTYIVLTIYSIISKLFK